MTATTTTTTKLMIIVETNFIGIHLQNRHHHHNNTQHYWMDHYGQKKYITEIFQPKRITYFHLWKVNYVYDNDRQSEWVSEWVRDKNKPDYYCIIAIIIQKDNFFMNFSFSLPLFRILMLWLCFLFLIY